MVEYAKCQLGRPYWYGTFGNTATRSLLEAKQKQYPKHYQHGRMEQYKSDLGQRVHDCVGLIKGYLWSESPSASPDYKASQDVSANGMLKKCSERGRIGTMPETPGVLVFMPGHVGIYIGNGRVIEARGFNFGVVETALKSRNWENWGKCPWIEYPSGKNYFKTCAYDETSIVDALKSIKANSGFAYRRKIAEANGMQNYVGTVKENMKLLSLLRRGLLVKP